MVNLVAGLKTAVKIVDNLVMKIICEKVQCCSRHGFLHQRMNANGSDTK
jgi:hypothetical protein